MALYVMKIYVGVASTRMLFSRKLSKLSFSLCNNMTYSRIFWQSMDDFYFYAKTPGNKYQGYIIIVHGKWGFQVGNMESDYILR